MSSYRYTFAKFIRDWVLIFAMLAGVFAYLLYMEIPALHPAGPVLEKIVGFVQPMLIMVMLFLSFCKIEPHQMRPHKWMLWLLLVQCGAFAGLALLLAFVPELPLRDAFEAAMLCMICPTATACAVVTGKLGGNMAGAVTYTVLINCVVALVVPVVVPMVHPAAGVSFHSSFLTILGKVFPMLVLPCIAAWLVRYLLPAFHRWLLRYAGVSFYLWAVSLSLAILMSTRSLVHNDSGLIVLLEVGVASLLCCVLQFWLGKVIGARYGSRVTAGQALGQKNTVFGIWMGYRSPAASTASGTTATTPGRCTASARPTKPAPPRKLAEMSKFINCYAVCSAWRQESRARADRSEDGGAGTRSGACRQVSSGNKVRIRNMTTSSRTSRWSLGCPGRMKSWRSWWRG